MVFCNVLFSLNNIFLSAQEALSPLLFIHTEGRQAGREGGKREGKGEGKREGEGRGGKTKQNKTNTRVSPLNI